MKKINVLLITNLFPNPLEPIRGNFVASMVQELRDTCQVTVISPLPWFPKGAFFRRFKSWYKFSQVPERYEVQGFEVIAPKFFAPPKCGFLHPIFMLFAILPYAIRLKKAGKIDLINAHWLFPDGIAALWISRIIGMPIVLSAHGCDLNHYTKFPSRAFLIIHALKAAHGVTVVSEAQKTLAAHFGVDTAKFRVTQNGADMANFIIRDKSQCRKQLGLDENAKIILFIGQLLEVKGIDYLLDAVKLLKAEKVGNFKTVILGEGKLRKSLEAAVSENGLESVIKFYGNRNYGEIPYWLGAADLLCLPSMREGCPCVVVEALASGRPVVASRVGGIPDLVGEGNGILVSPQDAKMLYEGLKSALQRAWSEREIRKSVENLSWKTVADRYYGAFSVALSGKEKVH
jgi:teichuronic acid biosynthesis glycosyltransferase TuaC